MREAIPPLVVGHRGRWGVRPAFDEEHPPVEHDHRQNGPELDDDLEALHELRLGQVQQMAREVYAREQALKAQVRELRIEIDQAKKDREVSDIVESEFFRDLKSKADRLRRTPETD